MKKSKMNWIEPDETDAFIYGILNVVHKVIQSLNTTLIQNDINAINSAKKYLTLKLNVNDFYGILLEH